MKLYPLGSTHHRSTRTDTSAQHPFPDYQDHHAQNPVLKSALELRYQVYCLECAYLSPDDYPQEQESDVHDAHAAHFYAYDLNQELVGYVRLIRPDANQRFPFQDHCSTTPAGLTLPLPRDAAEVSRLILRRDYRRLRDTRHESAMPRQKSTVVSGKKRHTASQVLLTLYQQMYAYSRANGIAHWYAAMEQPLARALLRFNFAFKPIGPQADYYGQVAPYLANLKDLETQLGARAPALLAWFQQTQSQDQATA